MRPTSTCSRHINDLAAPTNLSRLLLLLAASSLAAPAQYHVYVGQIASRSALLAWGSTKGHNTIGRSSSHAGKAELTIDGKPIALPPDKNWVNIPLSPDTRYHYKVVLNGRPIGEGDLRTYPEQATRMCFLVIGDYGNGKSQNQVPLAQAMTARIADQEKLENPVRFVLTTGDNIYGRRRWMGYAQSGDSDTHWETRFFAPYADVLRSVPFYPSPGNHDGSESENEGDLKAYLDNFFPPGLVRADGRYYSFAYANLAEFFALDSTRNLPLLGIQAGSEQLRWVEEGLKASQARWKIPYYHHPRFCGGPEHESEPRVEDLVRTLANQGVSVVFNGHEHNWQPIEEKTAKGRPLYHIITGGGGELRGGRPGVTTFEGGRAKVIDWVPQLHFTLVVIDGSRMTLTPIGINNQPVSKPLVVNLPAQ